MQATYTIDGTSSFSGRLPNTSVRSAGASRVVFARRSETRSAAAWMVSF